MPQLILLIAFQCALSRHCATNFCHAKHAESRSFFSFSLRNLSFLARLFLSRKGAKTAKRNYVIYTL
jgi:hypothetical protein